MPADAAHSAFERVLTAVGECLDRQSAEVLLRLRADKEMQGRIEDLADKSTEGPLTPDEREEYEALIPRRQFHSHSSSWRSSAFGSPEERLEDFAVSIRER